MEFEVTAIRKRPKTLAEMVGQDFVVATLTSALKTSQTAHAYLFFGPRGTGKTSTARILARSLNCEQAPTPEPCGVCSSCVEIAKGSSSDVIEIDGASNTSVNDVREIKDEILYAPQSSAKKIYIIDEVHMLSNNAFNALLKTIEEPPPYVVFVFATTEVHKVPATIRSRCQQFRFRLFSPELIRDKLVESAGEMGREFENDALYWIAREAGGSMRDAYTLFDQVLSFSEEKITLNGIREKMGLVGLESTGELMEAAAAGNRKRSLELLDQIIASGTAVEQVLIELADFLRNLVLISYGIEKESLLGISPDRFPEAPRRAWDTVRLENAAEDAFSLFRDIRYSLNPRYELELFVGRLCSLTDRLDASDVLERIRGLRDELAGGDWTDGDREKKKTTEPLEPVVRTSEKPVNGGESSQEAARFFARFGSGAPPMEPRNSEPEWAMPVEIGVGPRGEERDTPDSLPIPAPDQAFGSHAHDAIPPGTPGIDSDDRKRILIAEVRKTNITLAAALEKSSQWTWNGNAVSMVFQSTYEAEQVKNEAESLRRSAAAIGLPTFTLKTGIGKPNNDKEETNSGSRVDLVRQVFRGQVVKG